MELRGDDILLRPPVIADMGAIVAARSDDEIVRFIPLLPVPYGQSDAEAWVERCARV